MEIKNIECSWRDQLDLSCEMDLCAIGDAYLIVCVCVCESLVAPGRCRI